ncbi:hypothetical protein [Nonomuraea sp. NPDC003214]
MATLLALSLPGGRVLRCDARCYLAANDTECDCICKGANHGVGLHTALIMTKRQLEQWIAAVREKDGDILHVEIGLEVQQMSLFLLEDLVSG